MCNHRVDGELFEERDNSDSECSYECERLTPEEEKYKAYLAEKVILMWPQSKDKLTTLRKLYILRYAPKSLLESMGKGRVIEF